VIIEVLSGLDPGHLAVEAEIEEDQDTKVEFTTITIS
jgi:hypothetical protein